jgi:hypothetical protein
MPPIYGLVIVEFALFQKRATTLDLFDMKL